MARELPVEEREAILAAAQADSDANGDGSINSVDFDNAERIIRAYRAALAAREEPKTPGFTRGDLESDEAFRVAEEVLTGKLGERHHEEEYADLYGAIVEAVVEELREEGRPAREVEELPRIPDYQAQVEAMRCACREAWEKSAYNTPNAFEREKYEVTFGSGWRAAVKWVEELPGDGQRPAPSVHNGIPDAYWTGTPCGHPPDPVALRNTEGDPMCHCGWGLGRVADLGREVEGAPGPVVPCGKCGCYVAVPPVVQGTERDPGPDGMAERMAVIEKLAGFLADPSEDRECDCHGEGIDQEGDEWTLCECVLKRIGDVRDTERSFSSAAEFEEAMFPDAVERGKREAETPEEAGRRCAEESLARVRDTEREHGRCGSCGLEHTFAGDCGKPRSHWTGPDTEREHEPAKVNVPGDRRGRNRGQHGRR
jgi:hypothetical protein